MTASLHGARILVTRPAHQAQNLCRLIEEHQGIAVRFPTIEIEALTENSSATISLDKLSNQSLIIFTSANAVNFALAAIGGKIRQFAATPIAAIGKATAQALEAAGIDVEIVPESGFDSEALLAMPPLKEVNGKNILIVRGQGGREELAKTLSARGAKVDYLEVYKRVMPECDNSTVCRLLETNKLDVIVSTSGESLENLLIMAGLDFKKRLLVIPLVVVSGRIRLLAEKLGFMRIVVAEDPSDAAILSAIMMIINEDRRG